MQARCACIGPLVLAGDNNTPRSDLHAYLCCTLVAPTIMNGLGIDLGIPDTVLNDVRMNVQNISQKTSAPPKSSRRRAIVRQKNHDGHLAQASTTQGVCASLPSMPLRENRLITNKSANVSPMCVMKHPLPPKPAVEWSVFDDVHSASATRRADTPSDSATSSPRPQVQFPGSQVKLPPVSSCDAVSYTHL